ncbi:MAG: DNA polymerase III subunit delta' [Myxococcales bacterium]|nr:DNA polymerase III subunit delta' [Myxococcales bacterium]
MPTFADLTAQPRAVAIIRGALQRDRLHHALLLSGPTGAGKRDLALALASALNCDTAPGEGCGVCATCERIAAGVHPDVITLAREGAAQIIPIETVRRDVVAAVGLPPHEARERVFIVDEATALPPAAANALLKTLEEPPARTRFVLATTAPDQLLPTIRSRCQRIALAALDVSARRAAGDDGVATAAEALVAAIDRGPGAAIRVAQKISEDKLDAAAVVELAAIELGGRATAAAHAGATEAARRDGARASALAHAHTALALHHGNPGVSIEAIVHRLARVTQ